MVSCKKEAQLIFQQKFENPGDERCIPSSERPQLTPQTTIPNKISIIINRKIKTFHDLTKILKRILQNKENDNIYK